MPPRWSTLTIAILLLLPCEVQGTKENPASLFGSKASLTLAPDLASLDGTWRGYPPPTKRFGASAIYDPVEDRILIFGGSQGGNETWALSLSDSVDWCRIDPLGTPPSIRYAHSAIYDPLRHRMIIFGGQWGTLYNDVWTLSLSSSPVWSELIPNGTPPPAREGHSSIYDPVGDRIIIFGGDGDAGGLNDVWSLNLSEPPTWNQLTPVGGPPPARASASAIYDSTNTCMVMFGGSANFSYYQDTWKLSLGETLTWSEITTSGIPPSARERHGAIHDPVNDRMIVFGGGESFFEWTNDVWSLSLSGPATWTDLTPLDSAPQPRSYHATIYDPIRARMVVFGGHLEGHYRGNDVWALKLAATPVWSQIGSVTTPPRRDRSAAVYDPVRDRILLFGGRNSVVAFNDLWSLSLRDGSTWAQLFPSGDPPSSRQGHSAVYDANGDRILVFGGESDGILLNDLWELSLANGPQWRELTPSGSSPDARYWHTAVLDEARHLMIVFGGGVSTFGAKFNDTWALSLFDPPEWLELLPSGIPPVGRGGHTAVIDPEGDRMIVFGGAGTGGFDNPPHYNDLWALTLSLPSTWTQLTPGDSIPWVRTDHKAIYDPVRHRMILYGGGIIGFFVGNFNDVWSFNFEGPPIWSELLPSGLTGYPGRRAHMAVYDPLGARMLVFGGSDVVTGARDDTWELLWGFPPVSTQLLQFEATWRGNWSFLLWETNTVQASFHVYRQLPGADRQKLTDQLLQGQSEYEFIDPTPPREGAEYWLAEISRAGETTWHGPAVLPPASLPARLTLGPGVPNPFRSQTQITYSLPGSEHVELVIYDLQGRRIATLINEDQGAGEYTVSWGGRMDTGMAASGLYFLRLRAGKATKTQKLMFVR